MPSGKSILLSDNYWYGLFERDKPIVPRETEPRDRSLRGKARRKARKAANKR